jgi:hypothetical protein
MCRRSRVEPPQRREDEACCAHDFDLADTMVMQMKRW